MLEEAAKDASAGGVGTVSECEEGDEWLPDAAAGGGPMLFGDGWNE